MKRGMVFLLGAALCGGGAWYYAHAHKPELLAKYGLGGKAGDAGKGASAGRQAGGGGRAGARGRRNAGPPAVAVVVAETTDFPIRLRSIGYVEPMGTVLVKSLIQSLLLEQHVKDGQMVKKGDLLFTLDDREILAQIAKDEAVLAKDEATLGRIRNDLKRAQMLLAKNAGTKLALDLALANEKESLANITGDKAVLSNDRLRLSYTKIYAPIDGRAGTISVTPGNLVNASDSGNGLVTLTRMKPLRITFTLPERELAQIRAAMESPNTPLVRATPHSGTRKEAVGKVTFVDSSVEQISGTITLKALMPNEALELWPGQYCDIQVEVGVHKDAVSVPTVALQIGQKGTFVYVLTDASSVEARLVSAGLADGDRIEIVSGLKAGEKVVVDGQLRLAPGAKVREIAPGKGDAGDRKGMTDPRAGAAGDGQPRRAAVD